MWTSNRQNREDDEEGDEEEQGMPQELWTWTLWYKDSDTCEEHGYTWGEGCAERGDAVCQYLFGWRLHLDATRNKMQSERARYDRIRLWYFSTRVFTNSNLCLLFRCERA